MRTYNVLPLSCLAVLAAVAACGGISDPSHEQVSTVTGSLTGGASAPANARVALVWRDGTTGGYAVGADVPIVNGKFTMALTLPPNAYFFPYEGGTTTDVVAPSDPSAPTPQPSPDPGAAGGTNTEPGTPKGFADTQVTTQDNASGSITTDLQIAVSGFVVYVDTNNNGALDLTGTYATSTDQVIGGNKELFLAYLQGGGALDYEKLRDTSGILPHAGFNLAWQKGRWLSLDLVELKLTSSPALPSPVCYGGGATAVDNTGGGSPGSGGTATKDGPNAPVTIDAGLPTFPDDGGGKDGGGGSYGYPSPDDPNLTCTPDGRSFKYVYSTPNNCPPPPPATPAGLCGGGYQTMPDIGCPTPVTSGSLGPDQPVPPGWPCPTTGTTVDAGPATDASVPPPPPPPPPPPVEDAGAGPG